jgi:hypothetical protein
LGEGQTYEENFARTSGTRFLFNVWTGEGTVEADKLFGQLGFEFRRDEEPTRGFAALQHGCKPR